MKDEDNRIPERNRPSRSWITHSKHHTQRVHQVNVKLSEEANQMLREISAEETLHLYEVIEKVLAFYRQHHAGNKPN